jgi:serine/threonine protein kinase
MLLTTYGVMKLADFGVAQWISKMDLNSGTQGSPAFQPPEVASGQQRAAGPFGDIWAIGVLLYFITVGRLPFEGGTVYILFEAVAKGEFDFPERLEDPLLRDLISRILQVHPEKRPTLEEIKAHPWITPPSTTSPTSLPPSSSDNSSASTLVACSSSSSTSSSSSSTYSSPSPTSPTVALPSSNTNNNNEDWLPLRFSSSMFTEDATGKVLLPNLPCLQEVNANGGSILSTSPSQFVQIPIHPHHQLSHSSLGGGLAMVDPTTGQPLPTLPKHRPFREKCCMVC